MRGTMKRDAPRDKYRLSPPTTKKIPTFQCRRRRHSPFPGASLPSSRKGKFPGHEDGQYCACGFAVGVVGLVVSRASWIRITHGTRPSVENTRHLLGSVALVRDWCHFAGPMKTMGSGLGGRSNRADREKQYKKRKYRSRACSRLFPEDQTTFTARLRPSSRSSPTYRDDDLAGKNMGR